MLPRKGLPPPLPLSLRERRHRPNRQQRAVRPPEGSMALSRLLPRFRAAHQEVLEMERRESWTRADLDALQLQRLNGVWEHARRHVPYYRALAARLDLPERFGSLPEYCQRVPLLDKQAVRGRRHDFLSERAE